MDHLKKFYRKLVPKKRKRLQAVMEAIISNNLQGLDIATIQGKKGWYRCRVGDIRIILIRIKPGVHIIYEVRFRDKAYRNL